MKIYEINGRKIKSPKKIHKVNNILCHKRGDFYEPISYSLFYKIQMARFRLEEKKGEKK